MTPSSNQTSYKKLFIIDDDVEDQEIFIEAVKEIDPSILCYNALSGEDALKQLEEEVVVLPDIIFLDLNMPRLNGKQVLREIKNTRALKGIPVIMYSTSFAPHDIEEISHLGAAFHLLKPARFEDLCRSLKSILAKDWYLTRPLTSGNNY
jgi:CheY-like chemotaxis protein